VSENQSSSAIVLRFCTCDGRPTDARCDRTYRASVDPRHCLMSPFLQKYDLEIWFLFLLHVPSASTLPVETKQHKLHLFSLTRIHVRHKTSTSRYLVSSVLLTCDSYSRCRMSSYGVHLWALGGHKTLSYRIVTARRIVSFEILSNVAQLYETSHLKRLAGSNDLKVTHGHRIYGLPL